LSLHNIMYKERRNFDACLNMYPELNFMKFGESGRINFQVVCDEGRGRCKIRFDEIESVPIINEKTRKFRRREKNVNASHIVKNRYMYE
jgi:hypothetical protein